MYLCLDKVSNANFGHDGDGNRVYDVLDHGRVALRCQVNFAQKGTSCDVTIRETPPSALMSAGTRSSAMTAQAPASSAMRAYG